MDYATNPARPGKPVPDHANLSPRQLHGPAKSPAPTHFPHRDAAPAARGFVLGRFSNAGRQRRARRMPALPPASENFTKARAQGRAALRRYSLIGDRPGQCLVSDGFETRIGRADKAKPIQTGKFAIHTLGHELPFAVTRNQVCNAPMNRHSALSVGNAEVSFPPYAPG